MDSDQEQDEAGLLCDKRRLHVFTLTLAPELKRRAIARADLEEHTLSSLMRLALRLYLDTKDEDDRKAGRPVLETSPTAEAQGGGLWKQSPFGERREEGP